MPKLSDSNTGLLTQSSCYGTEHVISNTNTLTNTEKMVRLTQLKINFIHSFKFHIKKASSRAVSLSQEVVLPLYTPKDKWQCHETFWLSQLIGDCYWLLTEARDAGKCPTMHRKAPPSPIHHPPK